MKKRQRRLTGAVNLTRLPACTLYLQSLVHDVGQPARHSWARVIKASDFTDNAVGLIHTQGRRQVDSIAGATTWLLEWLPSSLEALELPS